MKADERRNNIIGMLIKEKKAIKGTTLAENFNVTRQIIVKDIAILRAKGNNIIATPDGYMINDDSSRVKSIIAVKHSDNAMFDEIWYVYTSVENRIKRLMASRGYSEEKCRGIMANQASEDDYRSFATRVLDNNGGIEDIRKQIASFLGKED